MANLAPRNLQQIRARDSQVGDCLVDIVNAHNNSAQQVNASPVGTTPAPTPHSALTVSGGAGYFAASITDNNPSFRGKEHFLVAIDPTTGNQHMIHLGSATTWFGYLGPQTYHFASYPSYPTSGPAKPIYQKNVSGVGTKAPAIPNNSASLNGWGSQPFTTDTVPIR